jgi:DNA-binding NarL/FixJ family response regulator
LIEAPDLPHATSRETGHSQRVGGAQLIRIGIVDDHPVYRAGLIRTLEREGDLAIQWELGSVTGLLEMLDTCPVDVVLMDLILGPDQDALAATKAVSEAYESVRVIVITGSLDWEAAAGARAAGASGCLPKNLAIVDMVSAIRGLASPDFGTPGFGYRSEERPGDNSGPLLSARRGLTRREQEVLSELRRARRNKEIAARLGVSVTTVNKHVQQVLKKLHARTRAEAVAMVSADMLGHPFLSS